MGVYIISMDAHIFCLFLFPTRFHEACRTWWRQVAGALGKTSDILGMLMLIRRGSQVLVVANSSFNHPCLMAVEFCT